MMLSGKMVSRTKDSQILNSSFRQKKVSPGRSRSEDGPRGRLGQAGHRQDLIGLIFQFYFSVWPCRNSYLSKKKVISNRGSNLKCKTFRSYKLVLRQHFVVSKRFFAKILFFFLKITQSEYLKYFKKVFFKNSHLGSWLVFTGSC